jgi:nickel-dependent lactate racemase
MTWYDKSMRRFSEGSAMAELTPERIDGLIDSLVEGLGGPERVLLLPPDFTRYPSGAGAIACRLYRQLSPKASISIMPALGTHVPMTGEEISAMFPGLPHQAFLEHRWRDPLTHLGDVPGEFVESRTEGLLRYSIRWEVNGRLLDTPWDRIISIGQLVPHEVSGISGHSKNILVGLGGTEAIHKVHYLAAVYGRERIMGQAESPVRDIFNYMSERYLRDLPTTHVMIVRGRNDAGRLITRGLYACDDDACFPEAARLSQRLNITLLDEPLRRVVVYLDPREYKSAWLGNKAIYRTCPALAEGAELIVIAPGLVAFGEDPTMDSLIRAHGYRGRQCILETVESCDELSSNLCAAAALINGSGNGRFSITYCTNDLGGGRGLTREEVEGVGYKFAPLAPMLKRYDPAVLKDGYNTLSDGEVVYYISNPGLGLWALRSRFNG